MKFQIKNGVLIGFADEVGKLSVKTNNINTKRVSYIYPKNKVLRLCFTFLRKIFGDKGIVAEWTRNWNVKWIVIIDNKIYNREFKNRKDAIKFEKQVIWKKLKEIK